MKNQRKGFAIYLIIAIIALLIILVGAYIYSNKKPTDYSPVNISNEIINLASSTAIKPIPVPISATTTATTTTIIATTTPADPFPPNFYFDAQSKTVYVRASDLSIYKDKISSVSENESILDDRSVLDELLKKDVPYAEDHGDNSLNHTYLIKNDKNLLGIVDSKAFSTYVDTFRCDRAEVSQSGNSPMFVKYDICN